MSAPLPDYGYNSVYKKFKFVVLYQTQRCNNKCAMCHHAKTGHGSRTMSLADLKLVTRRLPDFDGDVTLGGTGEAGLLKDLPERIRILKDAWPKAPVKLVSTLNTDHGKEWLRDLFDAGMDSVVISCYGFTKEDYKRIHGSNQFTGLMGNLEHVATLPERCAEKVCIQSFSDSKDVFGIVDEAEKREAFVKRVGDFGVNSFTFLEVYNWNGPDAPRPRRELPTPCAVVWGGSWSAQLTVAENLDVLPCCMFTRGEYSFGNLKDSSLDEIYKSAACSHFYDAWWRMEWENLPVCNVCQRYPGGASWCERGRMAAWQGAQLAGKEVLFYGCGETYRQFKDYFSLCAPRAILADNMPTGGGIDGIPVKRPEDVLPGLEKPLPLVIFAHRKASPKILAKLRNDFPYYKPEKLVIAPADADVQPEADKREMRELFSEKRDAKG